MLSLLLDENISPIIGEEINKKRPEIEIISLFSWQEGRFLGLGDDLILIAASETNLTLVTYDLKTIPPLLVEWGESGRIHGGIIFIDDQSIPSNNFGILIKSLIWLWDIYHNDNWQNRLVFLQPI
jgi:hypothetical protein